MTDYMPGGVVVTREGPVVEWVERHGVRVVSLSLRVGEVAVTLSLSVDEATALAADLDAATR